MEFLYRILSLRLFSRVFCCVSLKDIDNKFLQYIGRYFSLNYALVTSLFNVNSCVSISKRLLPKNINCDLIWNLNCLGLTIHEMLVSPRDPSWVSCLRNYLLKCQIITFWYKQIKIYFYDQVFCYEMKADYDNIWVIYAKCVEQSINYQR